MRESVVAKLARSTVRSRLKRVLDAHKPLFEKPAGAEPTEISFGPFRLLPMQFLLLEGDKPVPLGSRALELLIALLERRGELISKQELMARVWPNIFVEPTKPHRSYVCAASRAARWPKRECRSKAIGRLSGQTPLFRAPALLRRITSSTVDERIDDKTCHFIISKICSS
jgi:hypothetical protein